MTTNTSATTTLRSCLDAAKEAIISGDIDRAIDICFHSLCFYPKSIETHCLLGEAYREKGLLDEAEDSFKRVLSADPENLIARWALSILQEDKGDVESALWNLQLAFELNPGHQELRYELARLSQQEVFLTSGALGRIYARGELFDRAIAEFRSILSVQPHRLDVLVALGETLWQCEKYTEARALCEQALNDSPDCLKPNIILGHILWSNGHQERAQAYLDRARALDPENAVAAQLLQGKEIPPLLQKAQAELPQFEEIAAGWGTDNLLTGALDDLVSDAEEAIVAKDSIFDDFDLLQPDEQRQAHTETVEDTDIQIDDSEDEWEFLDPTETTITTEPEISDNKAAAPDTAGVDFEGVDSDEDDEDDIVENDDEPPRPMLSFTDIASQSASQDPQDCQDHLELAAIHERAGELEQAVKEYELAVKASPELVDRAIEGLKSLLRENPHFTPANRALGDAYMKIGKFQQAIDCYNKCLKK